ncbi:MAG TPA: acetate--CoA ligase family protein, partial [Candidatus Limnocylindrales bacterium]|nr:acetate--CoA ligase family protein [Candidatus Limnocylindrales bacterium]
MLREIRGYPLLEGYRGSLPVNQAALLDLLHRVSQLALDHPEISELDLNPVLALPGDEPAIVLDARLKLAKPAGARVPAAAGA